MKKLLLCGLLLAGTLSAQTYPSISNLQLRYEADCITSGPCAAPADGTNITAWADQSGNANTGTVSSGTCTLHTGQINGKQTVTFTGNCHIDFSNVAIATGATMFVTLKLSATGSPNELVTGSRFSLGYVFGKEPNTSTQREQAAYGDDYFTPVFLGTAGPDTSYHQMNVAYGSGGTTELRLDCGVDGTLPSAAGFSNYTNGLGRDKPNGGNAFPFTGQLAFLAIYDRKLTSTEIGQVESYLYSKYGVGSGPCAVSPMVPRHHGSVF